MLPLTADDFGTVFMASHPSDPSAGVDWKVYRRAPLSAVAEGHAPTNAEARIAAGEAIRQLLENAQR